MSAAGFLKYLGTLPRFDPELGTDALQGDKAAGLKDADRAWKQLKEKLPPHELRQLYADEDWINYRRLRSHTAAYLTWRRERDASRYSALTPEDKAERAQRARVQRAHTWFGRNKDRLGAEVQRHGLGSIHPGVLQEIERRYRGDAPTVYLLLQVRVALETRSPARHALVDDLRRVAPDHPTVARADREAALDADEGRVLQ